MINIGQHTRVFLAAGVTDMRKSIDGLSVLVVDVLEQNPLSSHLFVFCNRARDKIKILYWHNNGFWLFYRRLEQQHFWWPAVNHEGVEISNRELSWLLEGLDLTRVTAHKATDYSLL